MKYTYTITDADGKSETVENMSWKKAFKNIIAKDNKFNGWYNAYRFTFYFWSLG